MSDELERLHDWLAAHPSPAEAIATLVGDKSVMDDDGEETNIAPYVIYGRTMKAFWAALDGIPGWTYQETEGYLDVTHRWLRAAGKRTVQPDDFVGMDRPSVLHFLRWIDRGEKFCTGHWAGCFRQGLVHAAALALVAHGPALARPEPALDDWTQGELF